MNDSKRRKVSLPEPAQPEPKARSGQLPPRVSLSGKAIWDEGKPDKAKARRIRNAAKPGAGAKPGAKPAAPTFNPGAPASKGGRPTVGPGLPAGNKLVKPGLPTPVASSRVAGAPANPAANSGQERSRAVAAKRPRGHVASIDAFKGVGEGEEGAENKPFTSGFVALVGRPNVGKSTLLNQMVGTKVAIMSDKPQTTRNRILGVVNRTNSQMVFLDTPGIHKPRHRMGEMLNRTAQQATRDVDVVLFLVDGTEPPGDGDRFVANLVLEAQKPTILVVNKMDRVPREKWYESMDAYKALGTGWLDVVPVSALEGKNVPNLAALIEEQMEEGPQFYPDDMITDRPERFVIAELVREQILHRTYEEIPHSIAVDIEELKERDNGVVYCRATILVERESQRGILIGEGGGMLKEVGAAARLDAEQILGSKMYLELWVKVKEDWRNRVGFLNQIGLNEE